MQFRSNFFVGGEATFYNAGGVVGALPDYRALMRRMAKIATRKLVVGIDQWMFNSNWSGVGGDPAIDHKYSGDYSALDVVQRSIKVYPDIPKGRIRVGPLLSPSDSFGVDAIIYRNGFRRDGSRAYGELLAERLGDPTWRDDDVWDRIRTGTRLFEPSNGLDAASLAELEQLATVWQEADFQVVVFLPPYAPIVANALRDGGRWPHVFAAGDAVKAILTRHSIPFVDFTTCADIECINEDFVDGSHGGSKVYARILLDLAKHVPWLDALVDRAGLERRLDKPSATWELADSESDRDGR